MYFLGQFWQFSGKREFDVGIVPVFGIKKKGCGCLDCIFEACTLLWSHFGSAKTTGYAEIMRKRSSWGSPLWILWLSLGVVMGSTIFFSALAAFHLDVTYHMF